MPEVKFASRRSCIRGIQYDGTNIEEIKKYTNYQYPMMLDRDGRTLKIGFGDSICSMVPTDWLINDDDDDLLPAIESDSSVKETYIELKT